MRFIAATTLALALVASADATLTPAAPSTAAAPCGSQWTERVHAAAFPVRSDHVTVWWQNRLWLCGGEYYTYNFTCLSDTWASAAGDASFTQWSRAAAVSQWGHRAYHAGDVLRTPATSGSDGMWIISGGGRCIDRVWSSPACTNYTWFGDVWGSTDGVSWTLLSSSGNVSSVSASHPASGGGGGGLPRRHVAETQGGSRGLYHHQTLKSSAGNAECSALQLGTSATMWCPRGGHSFNVVKGGAIVVIGGLNGTDSFNDVWRSSDGGASWAMVAIGKIERFGPRSFHATAVNDAGLLFLSGGCGIGGVVYNDVWSSIDGGASWAMLSMSSPWSGRYAHTLTVAASGGGGPPQLLLTGGFETLNASGTTDAWSASGADGSGWALATANVTWRPRAFHVATAVPAMGAIPPQVVVTGGWIFEWGPPPGGSAPFQYIYYDDVWATSC